MLTIVGGAYREVCLDPTWDYLFGSGVRAAAAVSALAQRRKREVQLHCWISQAFREDLQIVANSFRFVVVPYDRVQEIEFQYDHPLGSPRLFPATKNVDAAAPQAIVAENVLAFSLIEAHPTIH